ncbi:hypothetical protein LMH87_002497 [Akanthomyces muscarius]|uniref:Major facilitator superfamily (MFS) profile domain-containing protein n=1 Tax=Akanthomyces muscarius TaxID=2231603 RepID=A0A9W8Q8M4_AKAMU|nr:hypothetical protein LMH87_002497 [Akanthomyces muscarius]KAJ4148008.1 hypothetical protein LMH87_002497 [Akanthomyces muscarius]
MTAWAEKVKFTVVAGAGFFTDGYINLTISLVLPVLGYLYFEDDEGRVPHVDSDIMKGSLSLGMIVGQVALGLLGDAWGRRAIYGKELIITLFGTLMVVLLPWRGLSPRAITAWISVFRVVAGVGIGADYPLSSVLSAEKQPLGSRAVQVLTVFSFIGLGNYVSSIVFLILLRAFKTAVFDDARALEWVWRLQLGLGMVPAALTLYSRLTISETKPYQQYVSKQGDEPDRTVRHQLQDFRDYFGQWKNFKVLFGTSAAWFLFDIAYYGINLNQSIILTKIGYAKGPNAWTTLWNIAVGNIIIQSAGYLPGFYIGIPLADSIGRIRQQLYMSCCGCVLYAIWAGISVPSAHTSTAGLMVIFGLSQLVACVGPNCTTFLLPCEVFPARVRGTAHGISAAIGKCGAVLTAFAFGTVTQKIGLPGVLGLFSVTMALTAAATLLIPEPGGKTLDDIETGLRCGRIRSFITSGRLQNDKSETTIQGISDKT